MLKLVVIYGYESWHTSEKDKDTAEENIEEIIQTCQTTNWGIRNMN
jgi:hypothetical protein